ncbi:MAG: hypothetical protein O3A63_11810 [Proteobacteria bacterium]|nr:hypothetical protein [Pseudomonadota bacterium]
MAALILLTGFSAALSRADPLFESAETLDVTITAAFSEMTNRREKAENPEERPATLSWIENGEPMSVEIGVRPRGKSRRDPDRCKIPPLRLNFKTGDLKDTVFQKQDKLKLVTHCQAIGSRNSAAEDYLLLEYLAYRMFNEITDESFRVRLINLTFVDVEDGDAHTHPAFVIESEERLAKRLNSKLSSVHSVSRTDLLLPATPIVSFYQYLVGNTDFSMIRGPEGEPCCHNLILLEPGGGYLPVPYDFDVTGFVNPPGALPAEALGLRRVTQRLYRGFCQDDATLQTVTGVFQAKQAQINALIAQLPGLGKKRRRSAAAYVEDFYEIINDPRELQNRIIDKCRGSSG